MAQRDGLKKQNRDPRVERVLQRTLEYDKLRKDVSKTAYSYTDKQKESGFYLFFYYESVILYLKAAGSVGECGACATLAPHKRCIQEHVITKRKFGTGPGDLPLDLKEGAGVTLVPLSERMIPVLVCT